MASKKMIRRAADLQQPARFDSSRVSSFPRDHVIEDRPYDSRAGIGSRAAVGMDGDAIAAPVNDPVNRAAALPAEGVNVVIDLSRVDRGNLARVVPLRTCRLVAGIT